MSFSLYLILNKYINVYEYENCIGMIIPNNIYVCMQVGIFKSLEELAYICETTHNNMKYNTTCKTIKILTLKGYEKQLRVKDKVN